MSLAGATLAGRLSAQTDHPPIRVAVSMDTLAGANVNDARAAYRVWIGQVAQSLSIRHAEILDEVFIPSARLLQMIRQGQVDCFGLTAVEYAKAIDLIDPENMEVEDCALNGLEMLLLVHRESPVKSLADLKGVRLMVHHHRDTTLVQAWLAVELARQGLGGYEQFFGGEQLKDKVGEVVLPVFFHREQAAVISRQAFSTAAELNPQLGRDLRVLAVSPRNIPVGFFFRKNCNQQDKLDFQRAMDKLATVPAGRQVMALYQTTRFMLRPCSVMGPTLEMIRQYDKVRRKSDRS